MIILKKLLLLFCYCYDGIIASFVIIAGFVIISTFLKIVPITFYFKKRITI